MSGQATHGILVAFDTPEALLAAAERTRERGFVPLDAFTPYPVEGLPELMNVPRSHIPLWAFVGGAVGGIGIVALQLYSTTINYPINVGGRPLDSWTAFAIPGFECLILGAALAAFFGMLAGNRLPRLYHPVFNARSFSLADANRFYLLLSADDVALDRAKLRRMLKTLKAISIEDVMP
jgi:hypothetical protein